MSVKLICRVALDIICLLIVWLPSLLLFLIAEPFQRGFYCNDTSIRYPYKESTVSDAELICFSIGLPVLSIIIIEIFRWRYIPSSKRSLTNHCSFVNGKIFRFIAVFLFGAGCSQMATDLGKYTIGRLRPHFYDVCQPESLNGTEICPFNNSPLTYTTNYQCTGTDQHKLVDARLSFPSGHSSLSAYGMLFLAIYLQQRMSWTGSKLFRPTFQIALFMLAWYTGLSRVTDYKHHWSDVFAGFLIGSIAASLTALYVSTLSKPYPRCDTSLLPQTRIDVELNSNQLPSSAGI